MKKVKCRKPPQVRPMVKKMSLQVCQDWFDLFGNDRSLISETGSRVVAFLLKEVLK